MLSSPGIHVKYYISNDEERKHLMVVAILIEFLKPIFPALVLILFLIHRMIPVLPLILFNNYTNLTGLSESYSLKKKVAEI